MADCGLLAGCRFFKETLPQMPELIQQGYTTHFCLSNHTRCARHMIAAICGREHVPAELNPHEIVRAVEILESLGHSVGEIFA